MLALAITSGSAFAQALPDLDQQQRQDYNLRQQELQRIAPPSGGVQLPGSPPAAPQGGTCVPVTKIEVDGANHLPAAQLQAKLAPFLGNCLGLADIDKVIDAVNGLYIANGLVTSRAYLPEQNLGGGVLRVIVVEGELERFEFQGKNADEHEEAAFPGLAGHVLNLRDLEQGLEQMNRLGSWNATMRVAPGDKPGSSIVIIEAPRAPWLYGRLWADNNGTPQTGRWTGHLSATLDDPLGLLDSWSGEYDHNVFPVPGTRSANYAMASVSIPHGYWTVFGSYNYTDYRYPQIGQSAVFDLTGHTQRWNFGLDRVLLRDQDSKTSLEIGYQLEQVGSNFDKIKLLTGSESLASLSARLSYTRQIWGGSWYTTIGLQEGLPGEGTADTLPVTSSYVPHAVYLKPSLDINAYQPFRLLGLSLQWQPALHAEYSDATEYATDRLQIGGLYTVRGFLESSFAGDRGVYLHNDIVWNLPVETLPRGLTSETALYAGVDAGWAEDDSVEAGTSSRLIRAALTGAALGIRNTTGPFFADVAATHALTTGPLPPEGWIFTLQAGVKF